MINFRQELDYFFNGLVFFSTIPSVNSVSYNDHNLQMARTYFPLIGLIIGLLSAVVLHVCQLFMPTTTSILLAMATSILLTGAFHEDGLADCFDGFGGGYCRAQIMAIMKDSRVGSYAVVGMIMTLSIKFSLLYNLSALSITLVFYALITAHGLSRWMASLVVSYCDYVQDVEQSKSKPIASAVLSYQRQFYSATLVVVPLLFILPLATLLVAIVVALGVQYLMAKYFIKRIGGYTGDCLGAVQQLTEITIYTTIFVLTI